MADYSGVPGDASEAFAPVPARVLARDDPCADPEACDVHVGRGSDDEYCSVDREDGHHYVSHSVNAEPIRFVEICSMCQHINSTALRRSFQGAEGEFSWLEILASRKRQSVTSMREIMEPIAEELVRSTVVNYTGWLMQQGLLGDSANFSEDLAETFMEEVRNAGAAPALDPGGSVER